MACPWGPHMECILWVNPFSLSDAIWLHRTGLKLAQLMDYLSDGIKPLSDPLSTWSVGPLAFSWGQFHRKYSWYHSTQIIWNYAFENSATSRSGTWFKYLICNPPYPLQRCMLYRVTLDRVLTIPTCCRSRKQAISNNVYYIHTPCANRIAVIPSCIASRLCQVINKTCAPSVMPLEWRHMTSSWRFKSPEIRFSSIACSG